MSGTASGRRSARSASPAGDAVPAGRAADQEAKAEEDDDEDTAETVTEEEEEEEEDSDAERDQDGREMEEGDGFEWGAGDLRLQATLQVLPLQALDPIEVGPLDFSLPGGPISEGILGLDEMMWGTMTGGEEGSGSGGVGGGVELVDWGPMAVGGGGCIGSGSSLSGGVGGVVGGGGGGDLDWGPMAICGCSDGGMLLDMASLLQQQGGHDGRVSAAAEAWPGFGVGPPSSSSSDPLLQPDLVPVGTPCDGFALLRWGPVHFFTQISQKFSLPFLYSSALMGTPFVLYCISLTSPSLTPIPFSASAVTTST